MSLRQQMLRKLMLPLNNQRCVQQDAHNPFLRAEYSSHKRSLVSAALGHLCQMWLAQVPISVVNGQFFGTNGQPTTMKGVNW